MNVHFVYIIHSGSLDKYYVGETSDIQRRLVWHNSHLFENSYTKTASDRELFFLLECPNIKTARAIEKHIKSMKSRKYYQNLVQYAEISEKLIEKYSN